MGRTLRQSGCSPKSPRASESVAQDVHPVQVKFEAVFATNRACPTQSEPSTLCSMIPCFLQGRSIVRWAKFKRVKVTIESALIDNTFDCHSELAQRDRNF